MTPNGSTHPSPALGPATDELYLQSVLEQLAGDRLIVREAAGEYAFRHSLTRDAVYGTLLRSERHDLHRDVAETIEQLYPEPRDAHAADLAYHFHEAGEWDKSIEYSGRAAARAQSMYAPLEAIHHCTQALDDARRAGQPPPPGLFRTRGQAHDLIGEFDLALRDFESAREAAQALADRRSEWQSLVDLGFLWAARDYGRTGQYLREALGVARLLGDPPTLAHTLNRVGNWYGNIEHQSQALRHHLEALDIFQAQGDRPGLAETYDLLGLTAYLLGDLVRGDEYYRRAIQLFRELGDQAGLSSALANYVERGLTYRGGMLIHPAVTTAQLNSEAREAVAIAERIGWRSGEAYARLTLADSLCSTGEYAAALAEAERGLAIAVEIEHQQWCAYAYGGLGLIYNELMAGPKARRHSEKALSLAFEIGSLNFLRFFAAGLVEACLLQEYPSRAEFVLGMVLGWPELIGGAYPTRESIGESGLTASYSGRMCCLALAKLALAQGMPEAALGYADELAATALNLVELGDGSLSRLSILRSDALIALGRAAEAEPALLAALADSQTRGASPLMWQLHAALNRLYHALDQAEEAARAAGAGGQIVNKLAANVPAGDLRENYLRRAAAKFAQPESRP